MIRPFEPKDYSALQPLCTSISRGLSLENELQRTICQGWVASLAKTSTGPQLCGFSLVWAIGDEWELVAMGTLPDYRRQGIGQSLLEHVKQTARNAGARRVTLEVAANNQPAMQLYKNEGFSLFNTRSNYYPGIAGGPRIDARELEILLQ